MSLDVDIMFALDNARRLNQRRKLRLGLLDAPKLFGEPAWDMLIDLFIHGGEGKKVATSALCLASTIPSSSALRLINKLCLAQLIIRTADCNDARRHFVELSPNVEEKLRSYFSTKEW